jgi:hypothetical protein
VLALRCKSRVVRHAIAAPITAKKVRRLVAKIRVAYYAARLGQLKAIHWNLQLRLGYHGPSLGRPPSWVRSRGGRSVFLPIRLRIINMAMDTVLPYLVALLGTLSLLHILPKWVALG